ncbi:dihydrofolate reductase [Bacillaceae bacterium SIJ1]|uniref:dihydrofolate reductase n=1 Tax=Litoribacterium kuwaitense TaxID=1398745 RepID=UPI0013EA5D65|nr:dihydrofolate reductase [Litoribacterium kuwaitense]NGP43972.1 dihydrofolate reductase [Litoribacterium kuwaitense]
MISMIWAMDEDQRIGQENDLPWHLPNDLKYFKAKTLEKPIVMGRKTYESFGAKPLPKRENWILTTQKGAIEPKPNVHVVHHLESVVQKAKEDDQEWMIIGGSQIYRLFWPYADRLYVTRIHHTFTGDTFFPEVDWSIFQLVNTEQGIVDEKNNYAHTFEIYERKS